MGSTMAGSKVEVAAMIKKIEPRAPYTHCYGHALNLASADTIKQCKIVKNALETTHEITKAGKMFPKTRRTAGNNKKKHERRSF